MADSPQTPVAPGEPGGLPAATLPGPHAHLEPIRRLGQAPGRDIWSAVSERWPDDLVILEFLAEPGPPATPLPCPGALPRRLVLDLSPWAHAGWAPAVVVTALPCPLPGPHARFELVSFVGQGGMGQVWLAESPDYPDLPLALKLFTHPVYLRHPLLLEQCLQEARVGIGIDSRHVARTYQMLDLRASSTEGWPPLGMVMPFYEPSLQRVLEDAAGQGSLLPARRVLDIVRQLCQGLDALHGQGLVHRDIKPSNVLFRLPEGRVYAGLEPLEGADALVADLGTLCRAGEQPVLALAQDGWKAPELFAAGGRPDREHRAHPAEDWFALGLLLRRLAEVVEPGPAPGCPEEDLSAWLRARAAELTDADIGRRGQGMQALRGDLFPQAGWDWPRYRALLHYRASRLRSDLRVRVEFDESALVDQTLLRAFDAEEGPPAGISDPERLAWLEAVQDRLLADRHRPQAPAHERGAEPVPQRRATRKAPARSRLKPVVGAGLAFVAGVAACLAFVAWPSWRAWPSWQPVGAALDGDRESLLQQVRQLQAEQVEARAALEKEAAARKVAEEEASAALFVWLSTGAELDEARQKLAGARSEAARANETLRELAARLRSKPDRENLLTALDRALKTPAPPPPPERTAEALVRSGRALIQRGQVGEALKVLEQEPADKKVTPDLLAARGEARWLLYLRQQRSARLPLSKKDMPVQKAVQELGKADTAEALLLRGQIEELAGDLKEARALYESGLKRFPEQKLLFQSAIDRLDTRPDTPPSDEEGALGCW